MDLGKNIVALKIINIPIFHTLIVEALCMLELFAIVIFIFDFYFSNRTVSKIWDFASIFWTLPLFSNDFSPFRQFLSVTSSYVIIFGLKKIPKSFLNQPFRPPRQRSGLECRSCQTSSQNPSPQNYILKDGKIVMVTIIDIAGFLMLVLGLLVVVLVVLWVVLVVTEIPASRYCFHY